MRRLGRGLCGISASFQCAFSQNSSRLSWPVARAAHETRDQRSHRCSQQAILRRVMLTLEFINDGSPCSFRFSRDKKNAARSPPNPGTGGPVPRPPRPTAAEPPDATAAMQWRLQRPESASWHRLLRRAPEYNGHVKRIFCSQLPLALNRDKRSPPPAQGFPRGAQDRKGAPTLRLEAAPDR